METLQETTKDQARKIDKVAEKLNKFQETTSYQRQKIEEVREDFKKLSSKVEKLQKDLNNETVFE